MTLGVRDYAGKYARACLTAAPAILFEVPLSTVPHRPLSHRGDLGPRLGRFATPTPETFIIRGDAPCSAAIVICPLFLPKELGLNPTAIQHDECASMLLVQFCAATKSGLLDDMASTYIAAAVGFTRLICLKAPSPPSTARPKLRVAGLALSLPGAGRTSLPASLRT
jgi:hypothetical protein